MCVPELWGPIWWGRGRSPRWPRSGQQLRWSDRRRGRSRSSWRGTPLGREDAALMWRIREGGKRRVHSETHWKRSAWRCRHCLSSAGPRPRSRPWSQSLHPGTGGAAGGEIRRKLQTSWLILPQQHRGSAFQSFTETISTTSQPNQLTGQNQVIEIWSKGHKTKRWSTGKQQKSILTEKYKYYNSKKTMEPSRHSKPI